MSWAVFYALYMPLVLLFDTDSYLHLAIAREYGQQGMLQSLDWARFSVMHDGYGDKELLFHLFLAPFAGWMDAETGGKLALALLNALIATTLFHLGSRAQGRWGGLAALLVFGLSGTFALRMIRLRPELLSVLLLLWIVMAAGQRRYRTLAALTFAYAYAHTAVQALFGLCIGWFVWNAWAHRRWCWQLLAYPAAAIGLAFVLHPQFPANLDIWVVQNVDFFKYKSVLDVGEEFRSLTTKELLTLDWAWAAALVAMVWSRKRDDAEAPPREIAPAFWIAALPFGVLFAMMSRFSTLFVPLATLGLLFELRERGFVLGATTQLPGGRAIRTTVVALLIGALGCTWTGRQVVTVLENGGSMAPANRDAFVDFDANLPDGATVAAPWGLAGDLVFWAPQGLYLNLFDPVFMAVAHPEKHRAQAAIFAGAEPDTPLKTTSFSRGTARETFRRLCSRAPVIVMSVSRSIGWYTSVSAPAASALSVMPFSGCSPPVRPVSSTCWSTCPVHESSTRATSSGVPVATMRPPSSPPSGPRSMTQSAVLMTSMLCSMTTTVFPSLVKRCSTSSRWSISWKCSPVVGSSRM